MSRVFVGAMFLLAVCFISSNCFAEEAADPFDNGKAAKVHKPSDHYEKSEETWGTPEDIRAILDAPIRSPIQYEDIPLNEVISAIQKEYRIPIVFDQVALDEIAVSPDSQVTINLRNIPLRSALNLIFRQPGLEDLAYVIEDDVLLITNNDRANQFVTIAVYRVDELIDNETPPENEKDNPYSSLVKMITGCVARDTWTANGSGEGEIHLLRPGILVVSQTQIVQEQIVQLLDKLRMERTAITGQAIQR